MDDLRATDQDFYSLEARKHVWMGAVPLSVKLHISEVTSLPAAPPLLLLAPRNGYLPLLANLIRPYFQSALPPGEDMIWFDYAGLPLKWHIPTGVLFDLLCAEPERPWNLTVHFRSYPLELLTPCENEETVKWNFINAMKEASYIMYGNTKSVMNMSQLDQFELWRSVLEGDLDNFDHISRRLRPGSSSNAGRPPLQHMMSGEQEVDTRTVIRLGKEVVLPGRIPVRLYIRQLQSEVEDFFDVPPVNSWDDLMCMTRPADFRKEGGFMFTLGDALMKVVPHLFSSGPAVDTDASEGETDASKGDADAASPGPVVDTDSPKEDATEGDPTISPPRPAVDTDASKAVSSPSGHLGVSRSYSDVTRGKVVADELGVTETSPTHSTDAQESVSPPDTTVSTAPGEEGPAEAAHSNSQDLPKDSEDVKKDPNNQSRGLHFGSAKQLNGVVRIQGIEANLDLPLDWVARNLCGPEQFVHLCITTWVSP